MTREIHTGDAHPFRQQARHVPPHHRDKLQRLLADMLKNDVIQPSGSPWASPVVLVKKKDGSLRFCIDYCKLNEVTRNNAYPLSRIDTTLDTLSGSQWFSTLDLLSGYWQVEMDIGRKIERRQHLQSQKASSNSRLCLLGCAMPLPPFNTGFSPGRKLLIWGTLYQERECHPTPPKLKK